jgi:phage-related protein
MGFNAEQMLGILIEGTKAGAFNMDKVGDAMKEFSIRAIDGSKASTEAFTALGFKAEDMSKKFAEGGEGAKTAFTGVVAAIATVKDPLKQNAMGVALFGTQWEDLKFKVIDSMAKGVDSIKSVEGATKKAGDALYNTLGARLDGIKRRVQDALIPFGDKILDLADRIFPKLEKALDPIIKMLNSLSPEQTGLILVIAGIVAAIGPALVALGLMVSGAGAVSTALAGLSGAIMGISLPIIAVVAAIALLVGAFLYLWNTNKEFKAFMITAWENIKTSLLSIWDSIKIIAIAVWGFLKDFWDKWGTQITAFLVGAWEGIVGMLRGVFQIIDGMMKIFAVIFSGDWSNLWEGIALVFSGIWQVISSQFGVVLQGIKLLFTTIFSDITENIRQKMNSIIGFINPIIGLINKITGAKFDNITNFRAPAAAKGTVPRATGMQQFALGTNYVPDNMVAMLHKGEAVVPAKYNNKSNGGITLNITGNTISNDYDVNRIMNIATKRLRYEGVY